MDTLDELAKGDGKSTFMAHVFNFEKESKNEMMNVIQYALLAVIPVVILNKVMQIYIPDADENKGSFEISSEIMFQIVIIFIGILIINRIVTYVPTYSEMKYDNFNPITIILPTLVIILSLQTKLGDKMAILYERVAELWDKPGNPKTNSNTKVKISQPIGGQPPPMDAALNTGTTSISQLDQQGSGSGSGSFDSMYKNTPTPLVGASTPGIESFTSEPMAASDVATTFGGSPW
jgi:hypothetical protein